MIITAPLLWYTSGTPISDGQTHCRMARYLGYHAGAHGTGWRRSSLSVPLATGTGLHDGMELIGNWLKDYQAANQGLPPKQWPGPHRDVIAWAATEAAATYEAKARKRGFSGGEANAALESLIMEQRTLIEAQVWVAATLWLPNVLATRRIIDVEREELIIFDCTCGLGEAVQDDLAHKQRGCTGIVHQGRADWLCEALADAPDAAKGSIDYYEFKTWSSSNASREKLWETSGQLVTNMELASRRLGKSINRASIPIFLKGWRGVDRNDPPETPKYQHSVLCYGYYDPGSPGFREPDWQSRYRWKDDYGKGHQVPKTYTKHAVWEESRPLTTADIRDGASRVETWVTNYIVPEQWPELLKVLGPFPRPVTRVAQAFASIQAEENDWRYLVSQLREQGAVGPADPLVEQLVSRSWQCYHYGGEPCAFKPICDREPGWEDPMTMGRYQMRRPHHAPELVANHALGTQFVDEDEGEERE
jgi:hypothetical protein